MPADSAVAIASKLLQDANVNPTGLGARDSLRLEAGLCLYGHDLNETINPIQASLGWTLGPPKSRRRLDGGFLGAEHILASDGSGKFQKVDKKRVGMIGMKAPAREHAEIYRDVDGTMVQIGEVTSGTFSPCLKKPIAMGYVATDQAKPGTKIYIKIRNKMTQAEVGKLPFVESRYYRVPE
jgi:aminomethyltransferase